MSDKLKDKFTGTILASAIGDALGMPFEGATREKILSNMDGLVKEFLKSKKRNLEAGQFTDDTQMMLCIVESIVEGCKVDPDDIAKRFVSWINSGDVRGAGRATIESLERLKSGKSWKESGKKGEWAAGNGAAMRIAPIGLFNYKDLNNLKKDCFNVSVITHNNPEAIAGATAIAYGITKNLNSIDFDVHDFILDVASFVNDISETMSDALKDVNNLIWEEAQIESALMEIGVSGYVIESVSASFYIFGKWPKDLERAISEAASSGGDNDTIACMTGALSGSLNGVKAIPERWLEGLEARELLTDLALKIFDIKRR